ncbi:hypothetical protein DAPPUDRAFT_261904 [Daphnia pulex]|uniref:Uncharacterized protein n=1 Tax=Daphnia pulex TaxID=6669 RepID=E9HLW9_DAPPU|nr:hypothetical protein DAPPUDRAFT_261904 [Daphnia pulex]|eukprot:EFX67265.1 hypothetical protein DAPPUDRAFT_261904 [Daphnia pulex]
MSELEKNVTPEDHARICEHYQYRWKLDAKLLACASCGMKSYAMGNRALDGEVALLPLVNYTKVRAALSLLFMLQLEQKVLALSHILYLNRQHHLRFRSNPDQDKYLYLVLETIVTTLLQDLHQKLQAAQLDSEEINNDEALLKFPVLFANYSQMIADEITAMYKQMQQLVIVFADVSAAKRVTETVR